MAFLEKKFLILKSEWLFVFFFSTILISVAFIPFFHEIAQTPKDNVFIGTHNNALDYPMFISEILQSLKGRFTLLATFTSESQPGTLVHPIYIPLGKLGAILNLSPVFLYHLARIAFAYTLAFSTFYFLKYLFLSTNISISQFSTSKLKAKFAFLLALFSAGFVTIKWPTLKGWPEITGTYLSWWTGGDVLRRAVFQPHAMLKNTLLLLILTWMGRYLINVENYGAINVATTFLKKHKYLLYSLPAAAFLGLLDPMNTMTILILLAIYGIYKLIIITFRSSAIYRTITTRKPKNYGAGLGKMFSSTIFPLLIYALFALTSLLYMNWVFENTPWKSVKDWEARQFYTVPFWDYANHIGITFYLGVLGLLLLLARHKKSIFTFFTLSLAYGAMFLILTGVTQKFGLSTLRFFQTPVYIFLAGGTAELVITITKKIKFSNLLLVAFALLLFIPSTPAYIASFKDQWHEFKPWYWNIYPDKKNYEAMLWLRNNSRLESPVLSNSLVGSILPAISGNVVFIGHMVSTINYQEKDLLVKKFTEGKMDNNEALTLIKNGRIKYVYLAWGEQDRIDNKNYPFLQKIYKNEMASIYKVED